MVLELDFQEPILSNTSIDRYPIKLVSGDFNGDGFADVAILTSYPGEISILLSNGNGTFNTLSSINLSTTYTYDLITGDFDGDGNDDLAVAGTRDPYSYSSTGVVSVLLGNGAGTFTVTDVSVGSRARNLTVGDFDGDGAEDDFAVVDGLYSSSVSLLIDGSASSVPTPIPTSIKNNLTAGDFNGDGFADLVGDGRFSSANVFVLINDKSGGFKPEVPYPAFSEGTSGWVSAIAVADLNGDDLDDVVTANGKYVGTVSVLLAASDKSGALKTAKEYSVGRFPEDVAIADFNGDGKFDIVTSSYSNRNVSVLLGNGDGTFADAVNFAVGGKPEELAVGDFNGDGLIDVATAVYDASLNNFSVLLNARACFKTL